MATTQIDSIIQLRRGTNAERVSTILSSGEVVYIEDLKRVYVGDGATLGGNSAANKNFYSTTPSASAIKYDLYFNPTTTTLYMLSSDASGDNIGNYARITPNGDGTSIVLSNGVYSLNTSFFYSNSTGFLRLTGGTVTGSLSVLSSFFVNTSAFFNHSVNLNNNRIINVGTPLSSTDAVNLITLNDQLTSLSANLVNIMNSLIVTLSGVNSSDYVRKTGSVMTGALTIQSTLSVTGDIKTNSDVIAFF